MRVRKSGARARILLLPTSPHAPRISAHACVGGGPVTRRPALVTGASSGIGASIAAALGAAGHPVALGARRVERCEANAAAINDAGGEAIALELDVTDAKSLEAFVADATDRLGAPEVVVSNAGQVLPTGVVETDPDTFAEQVALNLLATQRLATLVVPGMVERRRGDVVLITSDVVRAPRPSMSSYVTSKWGLEGMGRAMQMELEGTGVRVSMVRPGPTVTEMGDRWDDETITRVLGEWRQWGLLRHRGYLAPEAIGAAVVAVVSTPPGTGLTLVEVEPEAPVEREGDDS
jgi:NADP-dependent 3-hydroxy acid dehydrogenase YdfG